MFPVVCEKEWAVKSKFDVCQLYRSRRHIFSIAESFREPELPNDKCLR